MKKNLRIVSAAAAALLAVAPVAATVVPAASTVSAAENTTYDSKLGNLNQKPNSDSNSIYLGTVGYKNYTEVDAVKAAIEAQVKKQLAGNLGDIKLTWGPTGTVDLTKKSYGLSFKVSRTGVKKMKSNHAVKFNGKDSQYLTWTKSGNNLVATAAADLNTPVEFDVTVNGNATESTPSTTTPVAKPDTTTPSDKINAGEGTDSIFNADANMSVNINAVAARFDGKNVIRKSAINGSISATVDGKSVTALLHGDANTTVYSDANLTNKVSADALEADTQYYADFNDVTVNLGNSYAGKTEKFTLAKGRFTNVPAGAKLSNGGKTISVTVDNTGVAHLGNVVVPFYAYDATNMRGIHFYAVKTGEQVQNGSLTMHAVNGKLNVESVWAAANFEYGAAQYINDADIQPVTTLNDFRDQLKKANIDVDANGYFTAPSSFSINLTARSNNNGAEATLPITVNVDNATASNNNAAETTKTVTIMHISTIYDKNGKATHEPALRAYDTYSVVSTPVNLKDEKGKDAGMFYKLAGKDQYIKVGNVDGTSRSLKHNSYVYKSTGKRNGKKVLKKGSSVTTYGKSFMIAGHQMYRIGKNQYVKKANF